MTEAITRDARGRLPLVVRRIGGGPSVIVEDAPLLAHAFFTSDPSSVGPEAYDQRAGRGDPNRITTDDVRTVNRTMRARTPHDAWQPLTSAGPLPWLDALDPSWDLIELPDLDWERLGCTALLEAVFAAAEARHRSRAVATKVLHLKRPLLIPILDSLVVQQVGGARRPAVDVVLHLRAEGRRNRVALRQIQASLEQAQITRPLVRILDALLWSSHPAAGIAASLTGWERVIRPASGTAPSTEVDLLGPGA
jgi:Family of unknown function (DUF6308)